MSEKAEFIYSEEVAYLPHSNSVVVMSADSPRQYARVRSSSNTPATQASSPAIYELNNISEIAYWGHDNLFPQMVVEEASKSTGIPPVIHWKGKAAYGALRLPYKRVYNPEKKAWDEEPITDPDIMAFFLAPSLQRYYIEAYTDFYWFWNVFPDLIKNEEGDKIVYIGTHDATWCRWFKQNNDGIIEKVAVSSAWNVIMNTTDSKYAMQHPVVNPSDWNLVENLKADKKIKRFVYPTSYPSPGKSYYQLAPWDGYRASGWQRYAAKIPAFKDGLMDRSINPKYKWSVPTSFWKETNDDWDTLTQEQKTARKKAKLQEIDKQLAGVENAGKTILAEVKYDEITRDIVPGWNLELIENTLNDGAYNQDSQEAEAHMLRSQGVDAVLVGQGAGRNLNAGGGSDKLIAFNMYVALLASERFVVDEPVHFACNYNGYIERYPTFFIKTIEATPQSLDVSKKVSNEVQKQDVNNQ